MRVLLDYRPALRRRTGVGEFVHQLARALASGPDEVTVFTASWKDRPDPRAVSELSSARIVDRRIPVRLLNAAWLRARWPPVERLCMAGFDLVHSPSPVALPTIGAASVITIHDLDFLDHPEHAWAEMRQTYPATVRTEAAQADAIIVPSHYTSDQVIHRLGVLADRVFVCPHGLPPDWTEDVPADPDGRLQDPQRHVLFVGTLTARKNIAGLLDAYQRLIARVKEPPPLILAGAARPEAEPWLRRIEEPPLEGRVSYRGYVPDEERRRLFRGAAMLVLPSFDEGFGLPVLEAMALGVPVVVSNRGALPEIAGEAGIMVDPCHDEQIADAMLALLTDADRAARLGQAGRRRAAGFSWKRTAELVREAYVSAVARRTYSA